MTRKTILIYRIVSGLTLLTAISMAVGAFFKMEIIFSNHDIGMSSKDFQVFVWIIIISATISFFINWRLILTLDSKNADIADNIDKKNLEVPQKDKVNNAVSIQWETLLENIDSKNFSDIKLETIIQILCKYIEIDLGMIYKKNSLGEFENIFNYAYYNDDKPKTFSLGNGLNGQVALNGKPLLLKEIPDKYVKITSGSGFISPKNIYIIPVLNENETVFIIELADMKSTPENTFDLLTEFAIQLSSRIF